MLRFLHCADVHLGAKMTAKLPKELASERQAELRASFARMVDYGASLGVKAVLIAGDMFDSDRPLKNDKGYFYGVVKKYPNIDFLYLRGNHDQEQSYEESLPNLKTFSEKWQRYSYGNVDIWGAEFTQENCLSLLDSLQTDKDKKNVVLLHGQPSNGVGRYEINLKKLQGKQVDYLALGHLHSYAEGRIDERGRYAFSGCLEGRGFDELGEKGFILLETDETSPYGGINSRFIPHSSRIFQEFTVDISDTADIFSACAKVKEQVRASQRDFCRVRLTGKIKYDGETLKYDLEKYLSPSFYYLSVKNETVRSFRQGDLSGDLSLKGEFVRGVLQDGSLTEREKSQIISIGLKALAGEKIDE